MAEFLFIESLVMGAVIGLIELFFVHADERGLGWISHGIHALPIAMAMTFIAMNLEFAASLVGWTLVGNFWIDLGLRIALGLVATFKVKAAAAVVQGHNSVGEKFIHALIVGALIAASPYIWMIIAPIAPAWMGGVP